jgi:hypothetical protein
MAVGPRKRVHRTRPTGQLARRPAADLRLRAHSALDLTGFNAQALGMAADRHEFRYEEQMR